MEISAIIPHIEALIFASDRALTSEEINELVNNALGFIEDRASLDQTTSAIEGRGNCSNIQTESTNNGTNKSAVTKGIHVSLTPDCKIDLPIVFINPEETIIVKFKPITNISVTFLPSK